MGAEPGRRVCPEKTFSGGADSERPRESESGVLNQMRDER
jgi:hypothetical protein